MKTVTCSALPADLCVLAELGNFALAIRLSALTHSLNIGRVDKVPDADICKECPINR